MDQPTYPDPFRRNMITLFVMMGSFMSQLDVTIANVALPSMQGTMSASSEQITWVLTSYIVTAAIFTPLCGWLASRFGRKRIMIISIGGFTIASLLCGLAVNLPQIIGFRILQGMLGAALMPISQAVLLDINPPERHGKAMAMWGSGTVLGPIIGPLVGGWLTENASWRWVFFINGPVGLVATAGLLAFMRNRTQEGQAPLDLLGFGLLSVAVGAFQLVLDRGQIVDWYSATEIWIETGVAITALYLFVVHSLTARNSFVKLELFADRNFVIGTVMSMFVAVTIFSVMALLPPLLEGLIGYSAQQVGEVMAPRGVGAFVAMMTTARIMPHVDARVIALTGLGFCLSSAIILSGSSLGMDGRLIVTSGILQGIGSGMMFVPLSTVAFATLPPHLRNEGAAFSTLIRNLGGSMGISVLSVLTIRNTGKDHSLLTETVRPDNPLLAWRMPDLDMSQVQQLVGLNGMLGRQAAMMAYVQSFSALVLACVVVSPLILMLRIRR